jgi:hypothetical protein
MSPQVSDLFPSRYLAASDAIPPLTLTIARLTKEKMKNRDGDEEVKNVIFFADAEKGMVLNKTNAGILEQLFGSDTDGWMNQRVTLGTEEVEAFGKRQPALRFKQAEVKFDRKALLKRYQSLYEQAEGLSVDNIESYQIDPDTISDAALIDLGKDLKGIVEAAKAF